MSTLGYILVFTSIGSIGALIGGLILLSQQKLMLKISHLLASFAAGVLLGTAFLDLLPEAIHEGEELGINVLLWTLIGIVIFFLFERFIHWFHHHEEYHDEQEKKSTIPLIVAGGYHAQFPGWNCNCRNFYDKSLNRYCHGTCSVRT